MHQKPSENQTKNHLTEYLKQGLILKLNTIEDLFFSSNFTGINMHSYTEMRIWVIASLSCSEILRCLNAWQKKRVQALEIF